MTTKPTLSVHEAAEALVAKIKARQSIDHEAWHEVADLNRALSAESERESNGQPCTCCGQHVSEDETVWIDPATGKATMTGKPYCVPCGPPESEREPDFWICEGGAELRRAFTSNPGLGHWASYGTRCDCALTPVYLSPPENAEREKAVAELMEAAGDFVEDVNSLPHAGRIHDGITKVRLTLSRLREVTHGDS